MTKTKSGSAATRLSMGDAVKHRVTGFKGHITGVCDYITGCRQMLVTPKAKDGKMPASHWLDEDRLERTRTTPIDLTVVTAGFGEPAPVK